MIARRPILNSFGDSFDLERASYADNRLHLLGGRVFAASALPETLDQFGDVGADEIIDYSSANLSHRLIELTANEGVEILYDLTDGVHARQAFRALTSEGRYLLLDWSSSEAPPIPRDIIKEKALRVMGMSWPIFYTRHHATYRTNLIECLTWCAEGRMKPFLQAT